MLPRMSAYRKDFYKTKHMCFLVKNDEFLENIMDVILFCRSISFLLHLLFPLYSESAKNEQKS